MTHKSKIPQRGGWEIHFGEQYKFVVSFLEKGKEIGEQGL
jgi:hypothetical protein